MQQSCSSGDSSLLCHVHCRCFVFPDAELPYLLLAFDSLDLNAVQSGVHLAR